VIITLMSVYLEEALEEPPEDFTAQTSFMDAGLDSLDLLKVGMYRRAAAARLMYDACLLGRLPEETTAPWTPASNPWTCSKPCSHTLTRKVSTAEPAETWLALPAEFAV